MDLLNAQFLPRMLVTCIFLAYSCCFVIAADEEDCYRGEAFLDYDNPCSGDPGQPAKYELCHRGQKLEERCTQRCVSCEAGVNYQDKLTNCLTCLPCKTEADCLPGQIIKNCTVESDTVCGCPSPPHCRMCPEFPACPTDAPETVPPTTPFSRDETTEGNTPEAESLTTSCHHYWISLIVVAVLLAGVILGYCIHKYCIPRIKRGDQHKGPVQAEAGEGGNVEMKEPRDGGNGLSTCTKNQDGSSTKAPIANQEDLEDGEKNGEPSDHTDNPAHPLLKNSPNQKKSTADSPPLEADGASHFMPANQASPLTNTKNGVHESQEMGKKLNLATLEEDLQKKNTEIQGLKKQIEEMEQTIKKERKRALASQYQESGIVSSQTVPRVSSSGKQQGKSNEDLMHGTFQDLKRGSLVRQESVAHVDSMRLSFRYLSIKLSDEWRPVGRSLNLEDAQLDQIKQDNKAIKETIYNMFKTWKQLNGNDATFPVLIEALNEAGRKDLADHLKDWEGVEF